MAASHSHSQACCNVPPVMSEGYKPKGFNESLGDLDTYVTGPEGASKGLILIYDIFGKFPQTIQGADILATGNHKVFMPDWLKDDACPSEWYPPDTEEKQNNLGSWFGRHMPHDIAAALPDYVKAAQAANPSITSWGIIGFCWGGKVVSLITSGASNPFAIAAVAHPAMVDASEAGSIKVPYLLIASKEEPTDTIQEFEKNLNVPHRVETFRDQVHGFMAARANLADPHVKQEYARGYQIMIDFLGGHWP